MNEPLDLPSPLVVLALEDDEGDFALLSRRFAKDGIRFELRRATDGPSFLEALRVGGIHLILSDFFLPGYDGLTALDAAKRLAPGVPFLFLSGTIGEARAIESLKRGATDYVLKDQADRLIPAVKRAIGEHADRAKREEAERDRDRLLVSERRAREAAEEANRMKDEFLAVLSHELRTPLNAVLGWATLLGAENTAEPRLARGLAAIERNARAQTRLIDDLLDISRIVAGKLPLRVAPTSVETFVTAAVDGVRDAAAAKKIDLAVDVAKDTGRIVGDADRLQQVVWNLVANSVKFTPNGGTIRISAQRRDASIEIRVTDNGVGIAADFLPFVFDRFRQADASMTRAYGGLGMGLAIVRHLVELHGGTVAASSTGEGRGTTVTLTLPIRTEAAHSDPSLRAAAVSEVELAADALSGVRVLVVDDEPDTLDLLGHIVEASGGTVRLSYSVEGALDEMVAFRPHVIVSDVGMPDQDGYTLLRRIRALPSVEGGKTPAIALTSHAREMDRREAKAAGYELHVAKPLTPGHLVSAIEHVLGR